MGVTKSQLESQVEDLNNLMRKYDLSVLGSLEIEYETGRAQLINRIGPYIDDLSRPETNRNLSATIFAIKTVLLEVFQAQENARIPVRDRTRMPKSY